MGYLKSKVIFILANTELEILKESLATESLRNVQNLEGCIYSVVELIDTDIQLHSVILYMGSLGERAGEKGACSLLFDMLMILLVLIKRQKGYLL